MKRIQEILIAIDMLMILGRLGQFLKNDVENMTKTRMDSAGPRVIAGR